MKDILIVAHFTQIPGELGNGRFHYIAENIDKQKVDVEVITSSFSHRTKKQRNITKDQQESISYRLTMLKEPGYRKNVSIKRFYSHYIMGKSLKAYLKKRKKPDVIYCSVPSLDVAKVAAEYANKNNIRFIIDIQDLWPEAFKMIINLPVLGNAIFYPMMKKANYIYAAADGINAVSETYLNSGLSVNNKCLETNCVYLGTDLSYFDSVQENRLNKIDGKITLVYVGTLGNSYDIKGVIDALVLLMNNGIKDISFIVMGDGPLKDQFEEYAVSKNVEVIFTGRLNYDAMVGVLKSCDIAINPIKSNSAASIINKVGDYAAAGLPVINTQESHEYQNLLKKYNAGISCENGNVDKLAECINLLYKDKELRNILGRNSRILAEERFDRSKTYSKLISNLL